MINRTPSVNKIIKKIWIAVAILIILAAVFSSIFRSLTPWATQYKGEVEQHFSRLLGQPVTIQTMETGWYWFQPVLKLKQITINDGKGKALHLEKLLVGINLFKSLWYWRIQPGVLYLDDIHLNFRQKNGLWSIDGISAGAMNNADMTPERTQEILVWLAQQEKLIIKQVSAHFYFSNGGLIPVSALSLSIINNGGYYKLKGSARLEQTNSTFFELLGQVYFDPYRMDKTKGQLYFSANHVVPAQWQNIIPKTTEHLEGGRGNIDLWLDLDKGAVSSIQAKVNLKRVAWRLLNKSKSELIQSFIANILWKPNAEGWQFEADKIKLRIAGVKWPENQVQIKFNKAQNAYNIYVKSIIIESLLSEAVNWPASMQTILQIQPHGILTDTQAILKDQQLEYLLTRFDQLEWQAKNNIPKVQNLSGVIHWQPHEGRLELDSENTSIAVKNYPVQNLELFNGSVDWKELNEGFRISIERLLLSKPDLTISALGALDKVTAHSIGHIRINADFSAKNVQQWMPYLPEKKMKKKLFFWLNHDVKRLAQATGKVTVNGMASDFPFDNNNGEFSVVSHVTGGDIFITSKWPLAKELEGYIRVKNRNLDIDLINGDFNTVPVKQMNMRIDDIGKDKETLLIHGIVQGQAQKMLDFVMASPLNEKLGVLKTITLKGLVLLNLHLEIPLYPENDDNLAKGELSFKNNTIQVKHQVGAINIDDVTGNLYFDEKGVTHSALTATAFGYPWNVIIQSVKGPKPATTIAVNGDCTIDSLKTRYPLAIFSVLKGMFSINALFKITDNPNDMDSLNIKSSLKGLAVNLPKPLGKDFNSVMPLDVTIDYNAQKAVRVRANYNARLSTDFMLTNTKSGFDFKSGQIQLGNAYALDQNKPGLAIAGTLDGFDLQEWKNVLAKFPNTQVNSSLISKLSTINVTLNKLTFLNQDFDKMSISAKILPDHDWSFSLNQKKISGDLSYHPATNALSGYVKYLHLAKVDNSAIHHASSGTISPGQIPNLNIRIDDLSIANLNVGSITLKSHSTPERWSIDYCRIDSPFYQFLVNGEWNQKGTSNQSKLQVRLHMSDLAKSLERWQITPAVDAGKGDLEFKGSWNGTIYDFSLAALSGSMSLQLKNGRITNLSPETEEKLGLGKLLSILSLQTIPRRLTLDFSDLSHQGYSFDIFKGSFNVNKGIMSTQDSYIDGPVAYASMKGELDLVRRMYDLNLKISPHITASLPVVATIAGGPLAGLAAWVANKIINQSMQKIIAYSYKISGPWQQPVVQQLSIVKKVIKK